MVSNVRGIAAGFGATQGVASTDKIVTGFTSAFPAGGTRTYYVRARRDGSGGGNLGRLFDKTSGGSGQFLMWYGAQARLSYTYYTGAGTERNINIPTTDIAAAIGEYFDVIVSHRDEGTQQVVDAYLPNGQVLFSSVTSGTLRDAAGTPLTIGNRNSDNARGWDGHIATVYAWDRAPNSSEATSVFTAPYQVFKAPARRLWAAPAETSIPGNAVLAGLSSAPRAGMISGAGGGSTVAQGTAAAPRAGTLGASGSAAAQTEGVAASPSVGNVTAFSLASGAANAIFIGTASAPRAGAISARGGATAVVGGVSEEVPPIGAPLGGVAAAPSVGQIAARSAMAPLEALLRRIPLARDLRTATIHFSN